jgi:hypothetical protein
VSDNERPEISAFQELELLVRHLGEELATFRRRALQAETQLRAIEARGPSFADVGRLDKLEADNVALQGRLDAAAGRAQSMLERVRFLRQQQDQGRGPGAGSNER